MPRGITCVCIRRGVDPERMIVDTRLANMIGAYAQGEVQASIVRFDFTAERGPATIAAKGRKLHGRRPRTSVGVGSNTISVGESNPLIDTGHMYRHRSRGRSAPDDPRPVPRHIQDTLERTCDPDPGNSRDQEPRRVEPREFTGNECVGYNLARVRWVGPVNPAGRGTDH